MVKYELITKTMTVHLWYSGKILKKFEIKKGRLSHQAHQDMRLWIPFKEDDIEAFRKRWVKWFTYTKLTADKPLDNYKDYVSAWFDYYYNLNSVKPKFTNVDGKALKDIKKYLESISSGKNEALANWQMILDNLHHLDDFYRNSADLKFINSQLNKIITNVRAIKTKKETGFNRK